MITTLDQAYTGMKPGNAFYKVGGAMEAVGVEHSLFYTAGVPGAAAVPSPGLGGAALTTYAGQLPFTNPVTGFSYLACLDVLASLPGSLRMLDRLWHNSGLAVTTLTAQTINSPTLPARDRDGATAGHGVQLGLEVSTATTNAGAIANTTASYTNQDGTAGRVATMASYPATAQAGTFVPFLLQAGDSGIRSVQSITLGTSRVAGVIHAVLYRPLVLVGVLLAHVAQSRVHRDLGLLRLYDNTVPFLVWTPTSTTGVTLQGSLAVTEG